MTQRWRTPRFKLGDVVTCEVRGDVRIVGMTSAPVQWPIGKRNRARSLVVYADLAEAVRVEANVTVCRLWGVTAQTVTKWRRALGVDAESKGTNALRSQSAKDPVAIQARADGLRAMDHTVRARKIAAAKQGKRRPRKVQKLLRTMNRGRKASQATRQKLSEDRRRRGVRPPKAGRPWTAAEDALVLTEAPATVAERTGRTLAAVYSRRDVLRKLGQPIADGRTG